MIQTEPVSGLLLSESNPRFAKSVSGQDDAVTALLLDAPTKMANLARDIVEQGTLNPTEVPIAVEDDDGLVVIEGNRRVACLKLLANPELAAAASAQLELDLVGRFKDIAKSGSFPTLVDVYVVLNQDEAKHWIELRHTGENDGVGVLEWASWQANNFRRRRGSQADRATIFCDAIDETYPDDELLRADVEAIRRSKLTTLGRLVADPDVRSSFGFAFEEDAVVFFFDPEDLVAGFRQIFSDLAGTLTVTEIKTKGQRADYVSDRASSLPDRSKKLSCPRPSGPDDSGAGSSSGNDTSDGGGQNKSQGSDRKTKSVKPEPVIFHKLRLHNANARISKLLKGAQSINIDDSPQIAAVLIRILLELVVSEGIAKKVIEGAEQAKLKQKVRSALLALDSQCENPVKRNKTLEMAWTRTQVDDGIAVQTMNAFIHNIYGDPTAEEVRQLSITFRPVIEGVDGLLRGTK
ncbi:MAG: hypothetical protein LBI84_10780 [Propionibacteriaceae bacterium]|nr:hypothetical protein [Propionibacteriaceae bacterium]